MAENDFIVVGAGPAGVRACEVLVKAGLRPVLIDEGTRGGGQIYRQQPEGFSRSYEKLYGTEAGKARDLHGTLTRLIPAIDYRPGTLVWNIRDGRVHLHDGARTSSLAHGALIIASGATDRVFPLPGWTLPGVYTMGAAQIALKAQACAIGHAVVLVGTGPLLYLVAYQYLKAGAAPRAVLDTARLGDKLAGLGGMLARPGVLMAGVGYVTALRRAGVHMETGIVPLGFDGADGVERVRYRTKGGDTREIACDAVGYGFHLRAETQLADLAEVPFAYDNTLRQWLPQCDLDGRTPVPGVYLAGDGAQLAGADGAEAMGRLAAYAALADAGRPVDAGAIAASRARNKVMRRFRDGIARAFPWPGQDLARQIADSTLVCRCEAITAGTLRETVRDKGAPEVNRAKALSRVGMGRCQGRYCGLASAEIVAAVQQTDTERAGRLRGQAPVKPLPPDLAVEP